MTDHTEGKAGSGEYDAAGVDSVARLMYPTWDHVAEPTRSLYRQGAVAVLDAYFAAAQPSAPELCGCADAERTYEQLLDYTAELGAELDRQRVIVRAAEALVECDAAKPGLGQSISVWRRQRRELLDALAAAVRALLEGEGR